MAPMSSITASAKSNTRTGDGIRFPIKAKTPTPNAMSVAIGTPHAPCAGIPWLTIAKRAAGATIPPKAAASGNEARRSPFNCPSCISRRTSRPTTKKKSTIRPSLIQK